MICFVPLCFILGFIELDEPPESRLSRLIRERSEASAAEVTLRVHCSAVNVYPRMVGGDWDIHYLFQADRGAFRFDIAQSRDQDDGAATAFRYAFDGKTHRLVDKVDRPDLALREFVNTKPQAVPEVFDARLLGLGFNTILSMHHSSLDDVNQIVMNADSWSGARVAEGFLETYQHKNGLTYKYVLNDEGLPIRFEAIRPAVPAMRYQATIAYGPGDSAQTRFHARIEFKRFEADRLAIHEIW